MKTYVSKTIKSTTIIAGASAVMAAARLRETPHQHPRGQETKRVIISRWIMAVPWPGPSWAQNTNQNDRLPLQYPGVVAHTKLCFTTRWYLWDNYIGTLWINRNYKRMVSGVHPSFKPLHTIDFDRRFDFSVYSAINCLVVHNKQDLFWIYLNLRCQSMFHPNYTVWNAGLVDQVNLFIHFMALWLNFLDLEHFRFARISAENICWNTFSTR